jgi:tetratricopeptide (TPR) repeat protein
VNAPPSRQAALAAAAAHQAAGRFAQAVELFERAVNQDLADPAGWSGLVRCFLVARRPDLALKAAELAQTHTLPEPGLLCARAEVLQSLSRVAEAAAIYRQALALDPARFEPRMGLAVLALERGDWGEARTQAQALALRYAAVPALNWLNARVARGEGDLSAAGAALETLAADTRLDAAQRAEALLSLGDVRDAQDRPAEAFDAAMRGKALQRALFAQRAAGREGEVAKLRRLAAWFAVADPAPWRAAPPPDPVPGEAATHVFLLGFPRSGTTLLEQALAGHPDVVALEEAPTLAEPYAALMTTPEDLERLAHLTPEEAAHWRASYWSTVGEQGVDPARRVFVDKAPAGSLYLPLVAKLFPRAKVLFALRDPRDVVLSCLRQDFQMNAMTYAFTDLGEAAACYDACMDLVGKCREKLVLDVLDVGHEALIGDFGRGLSAICGFLGLEMTPAMLDVAATARARVVRTPSAAQVRAGLNTRGVGRWRAYADQLAPVLPVLAPWVQRFGYGAEG